MEIVRQGHDDRFDEKFTRICVHWDLMLLCNYKCSYCYARHQETYKHNWYSYPKKDMQFKIINAISKCPHPMNVGLLGGEPTLYPHFHEVLDYVEKKCGWNEKYGVPNYIYIVTNGSQTEQWFKDLKASENIALLWSFHVEFAEIEPFIKNLLIAEDKGIYNKVNILLHPNSKYWKKIEEIYFKCKDLNIKVHPHYVYKEDPYHLWNYSPEFWEWSKKVFGEEERDLEFHEKKNDGLIVKHLFNDHEVYSKKINKFKGFTCMNSNYEIRSDGSIHMYCSEGASNSILTNPNFFKDVKIKPMTCQYDFCNCDGLLKILKYKTDEYK